MSGSGVIDPSIILRAGQVQQQPLNLLAQAGQAYALRGTQLQQQVLQQELASQQAIGRAYQQATGPDGSVDQGRFRALVAADPTAAYGAQAAGGASMGQTGQGLSNDASALAQAGSRAGIFAHTLQGLITKGESVTPDDVRAAGQGLVDGGVFSQGQMNKEMSSLPTKGGDIQGWLSTHQATAGQALAQLGVQYGSPTTQSNGSTLLSGTQAPAWAGGGFTPGSATPLGIGPDAAAAQQPGVDAQGRPTATPLGARLTAQGANNLVNPGPTRPAVRGAQLYPWNQAGAYPQPAAPAGQTSPGFPPVGTPSGSQPAAPVAMPAQPSGTVATGPAAGDVAAQAIPKQASAEDATALMRSAQDSPNRKAILGNMLSDLSSFTSGPGMMSTFRNWAAAVNNHLGTTFDSDGITAAQSFDKYANQIAQEQSKALGAGTNEKLASAMHANPNSTLSTSTNQQMIHSLLGNEDAINAKAQAWQQAQQNGVTPASYQPWSQAFNQQFDPRAFQMLRMSPEERQAMQAEMAKSGQLAEFRQKVDAMGRLGLLPTPGAAAPNGTPQVPTGG